MSLSKAKIVQVCSQPSEKDWGFLNSGSLAVWQTQCSHDPPWRTGENIELMQPAAP